MELEDGVYLIMNTNNALFYFSGSEKGVVMDVVHSASKELTKEQCVALLRNYPHAFMSLHEIAELIPEFIEKFTVSKGIVSRFSGELNFN